MSENNQVQTTQSQPPAAPAKKTIKEIMERDSVKQKFAEMLGKKSQGFITSVLQIVANSDKLKNADPNSIYNAAAVAATMDLPINANLGFAYIVPYNSKQKDGSFKMMAQFQMGFKGFVQLAQRSGQFKTINVTDVRLGEIQNHNRLTDEIEFNWIQDQAERLKTPVVAYIAYMRLTNGFEKSLLMYLPEITAHGQRYSKTFSFGLWQTDFDGMARKTVVKLLLSKFAPLSIEMQLSTAIRVDQSVINDEDGNDLSYVDAEVVTVDKQAERLTLMINDCKSLEELESLFDQVESELNDQSMDAYLEKKNEFSKTNKKVKDATK